MITIFTPTYNRVSLLKRLYKSLQEQETASFVWLVVDDGSSDGTREYIQNVKEHSSFTIEYYYQPNQGKHVAFNTAVSKCKTPWFLCVDSDDYLLKDAIAMLQSELQLLQKEYIGILFPKAMNGILPERWIPSSVTSLAVPELLLRYGIKPETTLLFRTHILRKTPFPVFKDEKFLSEEIVYCELAKIGGMKPIYKAIEYSQYQPDGLTSSFVKLWIKNPCGAFAMLASRYRLVQTFPMLFRVKATVKCILNCNALALALNKSVFRNSPNRVLSVALYLPSVIWKRIRFGRHMIT